MRRNTRNTDRPDGLRGQRGQAIVLVAMVTVIIIGFLGLAIDGGRAYWERRILQNAVDAAALAASDNYQDSISISASLKAAATEYSANEAIYGTASANPSWTSTTVDITWTGSNDVLHIVTSTSGLITTFDVSSNHLVQLAFMEVLGVPSPVTIGALAEGKAKTGATSGLGLVTLGTGACPSGTTSLSSLNSSQIIVNGGGIQASGSVSAGTITTSGTFADNCTNPVPAGVTATGGKTGGVAPLSDPGFSSGPLTYWTAAQTAGTGVVLQPGIYAGSLSAINNQCYFLAPGVYQLQGGYSTANNALISNDLVPPDAPAWQGSPINAPNYNTAVASPQLWDKPGCSGSFALSTTASLTGLTTGYYGVVVTSTRTDYYPAQAMGGTAYSRESAPSTCRSIQVGVAGQGITVTVNNVPGATGYNVYAAYNATASPCNQLLYGYIGSITNGVTEVAGALGSANATFSATNITTLPIPTSIGAACPLGGSYALLCAAATGQLGVANPPGDGSESAPEGSGSYPFDPAADTYANGAGDRSNSNDCQPRATTATAPCAHAAVTPGGVQLYFPNTSGCMTTAQSSGASLFSGIQYSWIALFAPIANTCSPSLGNTGGLRMVGAIYWPGGNITVSNSGQVPLAGQIICNSLTVSNTAVVTISFNPLNTPSQGYSQISK